LHQTAIFVALDRPLLRHGEGGAFAGLILGSLCLFSTLKGKRGGGPAGFLQGKYLAAYYLRWPLLAGGVVGLVLMIVAFLR
jgi:hypothetical protein